MYFTYDAKNIHCSIYKAPFVICVDTQNILRYILEHAKTLPTILFMSINKTIIMSLSFVRLVRYSIGATRNFCGMYLKKHDEISGVYVHFLQSPGMRPFVNHQSLMTHFNHDCTLRHSTRFKRERLMQNCFFILLIVFPYP